MSALGGNGVELSCRMDKYVGTQPLGFTSTTVKLFPSVPQFSHL